jgi:Putative transmembrane protein (PGPGW)
MKLRDQWREFRNDAPGTRFARRYQRHGKVRTWWQIALRLIGAIVAMLAGLVMLITPGPGLLLLVIGAGLLAEESILVARTLDRFEVWIRRRFSRSRSN